MRDTDASRDLAAGTKVPLLQQILQCPKQVYMYRHASTHFAQWRGYIIWHRQDLYCHHMATRRGSVSCSEDWHRRISTGDHDGINKDETV